jgi:hypothetical protein
LKITKVAHNVALLFCAEKVHNSIIVTNNGLGYILADVFTNSSGHHYGEHRRHGTGSFLSLVIELTIYDTHRQIPTKCLMSLLPMFSFRKKFRQK